MNPFWSPRDSDPTAWCEPSRLRRVFAICKFAHIALLILAVVGISFLLKQAYAVPSAVFVAGDSRVYSGAYKPYYLREADFKNYVRDVLRGMFLMTEKGPFSDMDDFVNVAAAEQFKKAWSEKVAPFQKRGYFQDIQVNPADIRMVKYGATYVEMKIKAKLTSRSDRNYSAVDIYLRTQFRRVPQTENNPLGFQLFGIMSSDKEFYYSEEIAAKQREVLGIKDAKTINKEKP